MQKFPQKNNKNIRLAVFGDLVGAAGRAAAQKLFPQAKQEWGADLIIVNGENTSHGYGIIPKHIQDLRTYGADLITMGNHTWDKHILRHVIKKYPFIARPINQPPETPGLGHAIAETPQGPVAVISCLGRLFMQPSDCPFHAVYDRVKELKRQGIKMIAVDMHGEASSEKLIMGRFLDGKVSLVWGTHTHVQTSDDIILPFGTGYLTDLGMTGALHSVIGFCVEPALKKMIYGEPQKLHPETQGELCSTGIVADINPKMGECTFLMRFREKLPPVEGLVEENAEREKIQAVEEEKDGE